MMKEPIRLTNKTAIALRKSAQRVRTAYFVSAVIVSALLCAAGVVLGFLWLPAAAIALVLIALIDAALMTASRSRYLSLLGQAICTEAAAREIHAGKSESIRREQAISDLIRVKADAQLAAKRAPAAEPFFESKDEQEKADDDETQDAQPDIAGQPPVRRRRRQSSLTLIRSSEAK